MRCVRAQMRTRPVWHSVLPSSWTPATWKYISCTPIDRPASTVWVTMRGRSQMPKIPSAKAPRLLRLHVRLCACALACALSPSHPSLRCHVSLASISLRPSPHSLLHPAFCPFDPSCISYVASSRKALPPTLASAPSPSPLFPTRAHTNARQHEPRYLHARDPSSAPFACTALFHRDESTHP
jgi:hypothetical protein